MIKSTTTLLNALISASIISKVVEFTDVMDEITVLIVLSTVAITVENHCNQPFTKDWETEKAEYLTNLQLVKQNTRNQVKNIFDTFQLFRKSTLVKSYMEWNSQYRPPDEMHSVLINFKNISFSRFVHQIFRIWDLETVDCNFGDILRISFPNIGYTQQIDGNIEFLRSENSPSCKIPFNINYSMNKYDLEIRVSQDGTKKSKVFIIDKPYESIQFEVKKSEDESCQQIINEEPLQNEMVQAMNIIIEAEFNNMAQSILHSIIKKCLHPQFDRNEQNYSYFRFDPNMDTFPWNSNYNELIVTGLNKFKRLIVAYEFPSIDFILDLRNINIQWYITSVKKRHFNLIVTSSQIRAKFDFSMDYMTVKLENIADAEKSRDEYSNSNQVGYGGYGIINMFGMEESRFNQIEIHLSNILEQKNDADIDVGSEVRNKLTRLILAGMEQTFQEYRYDGTTEYTNTIKKVLFQFNGKTFANLFDEFEKNQLKNSIAVFSKIKMEAYTHLENITCIFDDFNKIGAIIYKNITGKADFSHLIIVDRSKIYLHRSAYLYLKQVNIEIMQQRSKRTNEITVQINDNFNEADTTISFDTHLSRKDRALAGKQLLKDFIELLRDQINRTLNSAFRPLFDTCTNSLNNITESRSNDFHDWRQYFAFIRGRWINSTHPSTVESVDVIIDGIWNFKYINARYENGNFIIDGLRMEDITGRMKLWHGPEKSDIVNYKADYLLLAIDHANTNVRVIIPEGIKCTKESLEYLHPPKFLPGTAEQTEKFVMTVASFIQKSIYGGSYDYHEKYQKLVNESMEETVAEDTPMEYDLTLVFVNNFVNTLKSIPPDNIFYSNVITSFNHINASFDPMKIPFYMSAELEFPITAEEICENFDYSQSVSSFAEQFNTYANITIGIEEIEFGNILFTTNRNRIISKNNFRDEAKITIDNETMKINEDSINEYLGPYEKDNLNMTFIELAREFTDTNYEMLILPPNICRHRFGSSEASKKHFYLITNTINDVSAQFLLYHIKLYGLYNLKSLRLSIPLQADLGISFEMTATNLTARIIWSYYIGNSFLRTPKRLEMQIDQIVLAGEIQNSDKRLIFSNRSRLQLPDQLDSTLAEMKETLELAIIDSIKKSVKEKYLSD